MAKININNKEVAQILNALNLGVQLSSDNNDLEISRPEEFAMKLGDISVNNAELTVKGCNFAIRQIALSNGEINIEVIPEIKK